MTPIPFLKFDFCRKNFYGGCKINKLEKAKEIIKEYIEFANCGLYDTRNLIGDPMITVYDEDGLQIDICYRYSYFEVFGLTDEEFEELRRYYKKIR